MGQVLGIHNNVLENEQTAQKRLLTIPTLVLSGFLDRFLTTKKAKMITEESKKFIDLRLLPRELALNILSNLNATDLYVASCVWYNLAYDDFLWRSLCKAVWPFCSAYKNGVIESGMTYRRLYLHLDEARLTFNADAFEGISYMFRHGILTDTHDDLVSFFHMSSGLNPIQKRRYLETKPSVLNALINMKDFHDHSIPNALRILFSELPVPPSDSDTVTFVSHIVSAFSARFVECNPEMELTADEMYILCFSLIMLSADLWSPHIKNKMSKREFIRNTRQVVTNKTDEFFGNLYDNVYIVGHVVLNDCPGPPIRQQEPKAVLIRV